MRIIFFGSDPWFSRPVLGALAAAGHEILLVVSKREMAAKFKVQSSCPTSHGRSPGGRAKFKIIQTKADGDITRERLDSLIRPGLATAARPGLSRPDVIVLAAYGPPFLSKEVLNWPKYGCLNVHASLLPRWRGASPVFGAIAAGDKETGVSIMKMTEEIDLGPLLGQKKIKIKGGSLKETPLRIIPNDVNGDNRETLTKRLGILGGELIVETLKKLQNGQINEVKQPPKSPTPYTHRLTKDFGRIDWQKSPIEIERFIRAVTPWPGAWTKYREEGKGKRVKGQTIKILKAHLPLSSFLFPLPSLIIDEVQLPGKNPISWKAFLAGHPNITLVHGPKKPKSRL